MRSTANTKQNIPGDSVLNQRLQSQHERKLQTKYKYETSEQNALTPEHRHTANQWQVLASQPSNLHTQQK